MNEQTREIIIDANDLSICYSISKNKHSFTKSHSSNQLEELSKYKKFIEQCRKSRDKNSEDNFAELDKLVLPVYKSRENIQQYFKNIEEVEEQPDASLGNISSKSWQKPPEVGSRMEDVIERACESTFD